MEVCIKVGFTGGIQDSLYKGCLYTGWFVYRMVCILYTGWCVYCIQDSVYTVYRMVYILYTGWCVYSMVCIDDGLYR